MEASPDSRLRTKVPRWETHNSKINGQRSGIRWFWIVVGLTMLLCVAVRVRLRDVPLERDEGEYAYAGQLILHGVPPYKAAYNMKLPGTYLAYAAIMAIFGESPSAIHIGVALVNGAAILLVFLLGRRLLDEAAGAAAAVSFGLLSLSPSVLGLAGHATHFVLLPALSGLFLLSQPRGEGRGARGEFVVFVSGLLFGLAFLMKQHGVFFGLFGGAYLLVAEGRWKGESGGGGRSKSQNSIPRTQGSKLKPFVSLVSFSAGFVLPYLTTCLVLWQAGVFGQFVLWTVSYAGKYASAASLVNIPEMLKAGLQPVVRPNDLVFWLLPWAGALMMWWEKRLGKGYNLEQPTANPEAKAKAAAQDSGLNTQDSEPGTQNSKLPCPRFFLIGLLFCSIAATSVGFYFRGHYFILLLPALALLTGVAVSRALYLLKHDHGIKLFLAAGILVLFLVGAGAALIGHGSVWFAMSPAEASRHIYGGTLFSEAVRAGTYLKDHTAKATPIAVLGSEPEIYFYANRPSATGYIYMYPLMEGHDLAFRMQEQLIGELEQARPLYVVYVADNYSWLASPKSERRLDNWWRAYLIKNMKLELTIDIEQLTTGIDEQPVGAAPKTGSRIFILKQRGS
jgi:hypothetical protein